MNGGEIKGKSGRGSNDTVTQFYVRSADQITNSGESGESTGERVPCVPASVHPGINPHRVS